MEKKRKMWVFRAKTDHISRTVRDAAKITVNHSSGGAKGGGQGAMAPI